MIYELSAVDLLFIDEIIDINIRSGTLGDTINFVDSVVPSIKIISNSDSLNWREGFNLNYVLGLPLTETLDFSDGVVARTYYLQINEQFYMWDELLKPLAGNWIDNLGLSDEVVIVASTLLTPDVLTLSELLSVQIIVKPSIVDTIILTDYSSCGKIGHSANQQLVFSGLAIGITFTDSLGRVLELPFPQFNDTETLIFKRKNIISRGGTPIIEAEPEWSVYNHEMVKLDFNNLTDLQKEQTRDFIRNNVGKPVTLNDHYGVVRSVIFQKPDVEFSQIDRNFFAVTLDCYQL